MERIVKVALSCLVLLFAFSAGGAETIKLAVFEPFTGQAAASAEANLHHAQAVVDRGIRVILLGLGSNVAGAVSDAVAKHNARNPDNPMLILNHVALDPELTNAKCHYYHFRFAAHADMFVRAVNQAGSVESARVASALERMHYVSSIGEVWMRPNDH